MAAPALEKTWQKTTVVVPIGAGPSPQSGAATHDSQYRQCMFELKHALVSFASGAWTVVRSCGYDSGSWTYGDADYWVTSDDVRYKESVGEQFSWIVLQQNGIKNGYQILIALENPANGTEYSHVWYASHSGSFVGGSPTTRPTASDEVSFTEYIRRWEDGGYNASITVWMSTDGACTRALNSLDGYIKHVMCFEKLKNMADSAVFEGQSICGCLRSREYADIFTYDRGDYKSHSVLGKVGDWCGLSPIGGPGPSVVSMSLDYSRPDPNGEYVVAPIPIWSERPYSFIMGTMYDCYAANKELNDGDMFPADGSKEFVVVGDFIIGNDGTDLVIG